jgi:hypothetical protein
MIITGVTDIDTAVTTIITSSGLEDTRHTPGTSSWSL